MDEMKIKTNFMKALISTVICKFLRSKGIEIDISISEFEIKHGEDEKLHLSVRAEGTCTDEQLSKLVGA